MIASVTGTLVSKSPTEVVLDVHGVGYGVSIPLSTFERLGEVRTTITLLTYLHVREDNLQLYGFATEEERTLFKLLISVSGIGPRMAQGILSGISVSELKNHIEAGNIGALTTIPGVGRRTSERLIVELREKIGKIDLGPLAPTAGTPEQTRLRTETLLALTSLGYSRPAAQQALRSALAESDGKDLSLEQLIKRALRHAGK
jgi:Holliday junction DNA helicase RuvA